MQKDEMNNEKKMVIRSDYKFWNLNLQEVWQYKYLIYLFVKRNYSTRYKQTILGSLWLLITPLFTVFTYTIVFGGIAGLSTDGVPKPLFYLAGNILWMFFSNSLAQTSSTFTGNAGIFGKIYFPRLVIPISTVITVVLDFLIQLGLLLGLTVIYRYNGQGVDLNYLLLIIMLPLILLQLGLLAMGLGIMVSALTTKYRDLSVLVGFGLQVWMYISPVIYSTTLVPEKYTILFMLNPVAPAILIFKYIYFGIGTIPWIYWGISWLISVLVFFAGIVIFNKVERTFMDTV